MVLLLVALATGCGDRCDRLCVDVRDRIDTCRSPSLTWQDLGARGRADFLVQCRRDWDATSATLNTREVELALDVCGDALDDVDDLSCDEVRAMYAPQ